MTTDSTASDDPTPPAQEPQAADAIEAANEPQHTLDRRSPAMIDGLSGPPLTLLQLQSRIMHAWPSAGCAIAHGELTVHVQPDKVRDVLTWARDDVEVSTRVLSDLSGVHWPAGDHVIERQPSTTGWPDYRVSRDQGTIEVLYVLRSWQRNHLFRVAVSTPDDEPVLPSVVDIFPTANFHEREVFDMFGVVFEGHPDLRRILMPDDWVGHPHRKDYPLGGVDIPYENDKHIPPPNERDLREVVR